MFESNQKIVSSIFEFSFNKTFDLNISFIQKLCDNILKKYYKKNNIQKNLEPIHWPGDNICTRRKKFL